MNQAEAELAKFGDQCGADLMPGPKGYIHGWQYVGGPGLPGHNSGGSDFPGSESTHGNRLRTQRVRLETSQHGDVVTIHLIQTPPELRGRGAARAAMQQLIERADKDGLTLALTPEPLAGDRKTSKTKLRAWYRSMGFVPHNGAKSMSGISATMIRRPKAT